MSVTLFRCALLLAVAAPLTALATPNDRIAYDIHGTVEQSDMREMLNHGTLVQESGALPGVGASVTFIHGSLRVGGTGDLLASQLDYKGHLQQSNTPYNSQSGTVFFRTGAQAAWHPGDLDLHAGLGLNSWYRRVDGSGNVGTVTEDYAWLATHAGAAYTFALGKADSLTPEADYLFNTGIRQQADNPGYDTVHLKPKAHAGSLLALRWTHQQADNTRFGLRLYWQKYKFGQSRIVVGTQGGVGTSIGFFQPEERFDQVGLSFFYGQEKNYP